MACLVGGRRRLVPPVQRPAERGRGPPAVAYVHRRPLLHQAPHHALGAGVRRPVQRRLPEEPPAVHPRAGVEQDVHHVGRAQADRRVQRVAVGEVHVRSRGDQGAHERRAVARRQRAVEQPVADEVDRVREELVVLAPLDERVRARAVRGEKRLQGHDVAALDRAAHIHRRPPACSRVMTAAVGVDDPQTAMRPRTMRAHGNMPARCSASREPTFPWLQRAAGVWPVS